MSEVTSNKAYLEQNMNSISNETTTGYKNITIKTVNYESTTNVPSKEPTLIERLLETSKELYEKLMTETSNVKTVADEFQTMDCYLSESATNLGFEVKSNKLDEVDLKNYTATDLSELFSKEVPIIPGYNDNITKPTGITGQTYYPTETYPTTTTTPTETTPVETKPTEEKPVEEKPIEEKPEEEKPTEEKPIEEKPTEEKPEEEFVEEYVEPTVPGEMEPSKEMIEAAEKLEQKPQLETTQPIQEQEPPQQEPPKPQQTVQQKPQKQVEKFVSGSSSSPKAEPPKQPEPIIEPEIQAEQPVQEPVEHQIPEQPQIPLPEENATDTIVPVDGGVKEVKQEAPVQKSNTGKVVGAVLGTAAVAGAGAAGYMIYKKKQEDEEYKDYDYDGGEY